jgi:glycogen debranching enzyme
MQIDLNTVPFSRYGSYLAFSMLPETESRPAGLYLRSLHGEAQVREVARLEVIKDGVSLPFQPQASASVLRLEAEGGRVELCFAGDRSIHLRGRGAGLRLTFTPGAFDCAFPAHGRDWQVTTFASAINLNLSAQASEWRVDAPFHGARAEHLQAELQPDWLSHTCEGWISEFNSVYQPPEKTNPFEYDAAQLELEFKTWLERTPSLPRQYDAARELAAYINWASVVAPNGILMRPTMFMSKNRMANVWSWDHCFNAMALAYHQPDLAWDQFMTLFDQQDEFGALPDSVNDLRRVWSFCKPPIHGWTLLHLMQQQPELAIHERLEEVYGPLSCWTEWWFRHRDYDNDGIPQYHHGNDSGWDNCTAFEGGLPLEAPDLSAFLVIQMEALSQVAAKLGRKAEANNWQRRSQALLEHMLSHFWRLNRFMVVQSGTHQESWTETLFNFLPLLLGRRLPLQVQQALVQAITMPGFLLTEYGLATESPRSKLYQPDGYWRGPIWAPPTLMMVEGLAAVGRDKLAKDLARQFCDMAAQSGMAENFDALTGAGLRDRAYTWTSSVFLILGHEYLKD